MFEENRSVTVCYCQFDGGKSRNELTSQLAKLPILMEVLSGSSKQIECFLSVELSRNLFLLFKPKSNVDNFHESDININE